MRIIKLINGYYIEIDPLNYTLRQEYIGKTKEGKEKKGTSQCISHEPAAFWQRAERRAK